MSEAAASEEEAALFALVMAEGVETNALDLILPPPAPPPSPPLPVGGGGGGGGVADSAVVTAAEGKQNK